MRDALYSIPPANLPDTPVTRRDMAAFKQSARSLDHGVGAVLGALDEQGLADDTLVILTTDHGLPFPGAKATLSDRGHRRAADHARARRLPRRPGDGRAGLADRPLPDALRAGRDRAARRTCRAARCCPLVRARDAATSTTRSSPSSPTTPPTTRSAPIRTRRHKYVRRFGERDLPVLPNIDDSPSKDLLLDAGLGRAAAAARGALRPRVRPERGAQPRRRTRPRGRPRRRCASGSTTWMRGDGRPAARRPGAAAARRARSTTPPASRAAEAPRRRPRAARPVAAQ